jgi:hypothetical protein
VGQLRGRAGERLGESRTYFFLALADCQLKLDETTETPRAPLRPLGLHEERGKMTYRSAYLTTDEAAELLRVHPGAPPAAVTIELIVGWVGMSRISMA